jgi:hypothetical protein
MGLMRHFWDAAIEQTRASAPHPRPRFAICSLEPLRDAFGRAGLSDVDVLPIDIRPSSATSTTTGKPFLMATGPPRHADEPSEDHRATSPPSPGAAPDEPTARSYRRPEHGGSRTP